MTTAPVVVERGTARPCTRPDTDPDWWDIAAPRAHQLRAVSLCAQCPLATARQCRRDARRENAHGVIRDGKAWRKGRPSPIHAARRSVN